MRRVDVFRWGAIGYGAWQALLLMGCRDVPPALVPDVFQAEPTPPAIRTAPFELDGTSPAPLIPSRTAEQCRAQKIIMLDSGVEMDSDSLSWQLYSPDTPPITGGNGDDYTTSFNLVGDPEVGVMVTFATHITGKQPTLESYAFTDPGMAVFEQVHTRPMNILDPEVQAKLRASGITTEEIDELKNQILRNPLGSINATNHYGYRLFRQNCDGTVESAFVAPDDIGIHLEFVLPAPESKRPMIPEFLTAYPGVGPDLSA